jgi:hypothetical protein
MALSREADHSWTRIATQGGAEEGRKQMKKTGPCGSMKEESPARWAVAAATAQ